MIELTVRTLDSQNHRFSVDDDITVEQFKAHIADTVNISAQTQRIIYCGRVLNDASKLSDYDVNGKVVHLVQRVPPSQNQRSNPSNTAGNAQNAQQRISSPQRHRQRNFMRGFEPGNPMYPSMAFPANLMEPQGYVAPLPTHSLAGSRLNVARRMLRRAEAVIRLLENPQARPADQSPPDEPQEEEVTPVIEARVIAAHPIDEAMVLSVVQGSLINVAQGMVSVLRDQYGSPVGNNSSPPSTTAAPTSTTPSAAAGASEGQETPESSSTRHSSNENLTEAAPPRPESTTPSTNNAGASGTASASASATASSTATGLADNASSTREMAELLTTLGQLQTRFAPFLEFYLNFMQEDPVVPRENLRQTQGTLTRVSEVMHFFSHAYHSLSDIMVRVRTPPPRPLLCRPILIQRSAVVQAGIPIQVEAEINVSTERPRPQAQAPPTTTTSTSDSPSSTTPTNQDTPSANAATNPTASVPMQHTINAADLLGGFPLLPMRVQSFPIEIRAMARPSTTNNNNSTNSVPTGTASTGASTGTGVGSAAEGDAGTNSAADAAGINLGVSGNMTTMSGRTATWNAMPVNNDGNVEFFMELAGNNETNELSGAELFQSLMQMAGQLIDRGEGQPQNPPSTTTNQTDSTNTNTTAASNLGASTANSSTSSQAGAAQNSQNSQARGNTQTNPTTATHTRSTPRPHVHLAQQAMQAGFDPFLPCNSYHVTPRRGLLHPAAASVAAGQQFEGLPPGVRVEIGGRPISGLNMGNIGAAAANGGGGARDARDVGRRQQNIFNFITDVLGAIRTTAGRPGQGQAQAQAAGAGQQQGASNTGPQRQQPQQRSASGSAPGSGEVPVILQNLQGQQMNDYFRPEPTIYHIMERLLRPDENFAQNEGIITDLILMLFRNLTLVDLWALNSGHTEPINRSRNEIQSFIRTRVLENDTTPVGIERAVERIMVELRPFFDNFTLMDIRDDIDIVRSTERLFRTHLPVLIERGAFLCTSNVPQLIKDCIMVVKHLCGLLVRSTVNGEANFLQSFERIVERYLDVPLEILMWVFSTSRIPFRQFIENLNVPDSVTDRYIVRRGEPDVSVSSSEPLNAENVAADVQIGDSCAQTQSASVEAMELDDQEQDASGSSNEMEAAPIVEDGESLPNIVLGSEPWHAQVPADWVPIIARDASKQRRQNTQAPFSDAYLSGMPSKRRKIVQNSKPSSSLQQTITESIRQAVTSTGLTSAANLDTVVLAAGESPEIQTAYRNLLRSSVQSNLRENEDFTAERYPNASNYFNNPSQQQ